MQFESDYRFDIDDTFTLCSQSMSACPSTASSFSSAPSVYDPFTPSSRRSTPNELAINFADSSCYTGPQTAEMTPPSTMSKFMLGPIKQEAEQMFFSSESLPTTPMKKIEYINFDSLVDMNLPSHPSLGTITPSQSFGLHHTYSPEAPQSYIMTPTHSMSGSEIADSSSSWSVVNESPIAFLQQRNLPYNDIDGLDMGHVPMSPMPYHMQSSGSPNRLRMQRKMMLHEAQRKTSELQRAQRKRADKSEAPPMDVVRRAMCKCDYPGCNKAFRRNEHLKRHKQTYHGEGPNRFSCEFCGKDQFNRQDNLNNHRKLHARPNSRNRGVEFIPAAVAVIELEERSRKRRAPPKSKTAAQKHGYEDY